MFHTSSIPAISAEELKKKLAANEAMTLLDVRRPDEWAQTGVISGSIMLEMQSLPHEMENGLNLKSKEPVIVICRSGNRSGQVTRYLRERYNIQAFNLSGGVIAWNRIGERFERI